LGEGEAAGVQDRVNERRSLTGAQRARGPSATEGAQMSAYVNQQCRRLANVLLLYGLRTEPIEWVDVEDVLPLIDDDPFAVPAIALALRTLVEDGHAVATIADGKAFYQRTEAGLRRAEVVFRDRRFSLESALRVSRADTTKADPPGH
jgi:hypothetical protein